MKKDYDVTLTIEHLAEQIKSAVTIAGNVNQPFTAAQVLSIAYNLRNKPDVKKTWPNFKRHFAVAYANNLEEHTATGMGYDANAVQQQGDLTEALKHLANLVLSDWLALTNLTRANLMLAKQLEKAQEEIDKLKKKDKKVLNNVNNFRAGMHLVFYYWSHGIIVTLNHTSQSCVRPKVGHKKEATLTNMMGGKTKLNIPFGRNNKNDSAWGEMMGKTNID
eukprot:11388641-Ditylum_brightwellii.AAC.1